MPRYAIAPWDLTTVPVAGSDQVFPVHRIYCVGRNYAAHAREMGGDERDPPFFFSKPADALVLGSEAPFPPATDDLHHEVELVVALKSGGSNIPESEALDHVLGYAVGVDLTRRDLQAEAKKAGRPWDMAKGFDHSAPMSSIALATEVGHPSEAGIKLTVNGDTRQDGNVRDMIWTVPETIAYLSGLVELKPGDLIFTGTPDGVSQVKKGDTIGAELEGVGRLSVRLT